MEPEITKKTLAERIPGWARPLLQALSLILCLCLLGNLFSLMFTADLRQVAQEEGFATLVDTFFSTYMDQLKTPGRSARSGGSIMPESGSPNFLDPDSLVDWVYGVVQNAFGGDAAITKDNVRNFLAESTVKDFLADKVTSSVTGLLGSGDVQDLLTNQEIKDLMEENKALIAREFGVEMTPQRMEMFVDVVAGTLEKNDLNGKFKGFVERFVKGEEPILLGISGQDVVRYLVKRITGSMFSQQLLTCLVLVVQLCLANFYNIPAGLTWAAFPCLISGGILALVTGLLQLPASMASMASVLDTLKAMIAPVHYTVLGVGVALLVISIAWRIIRSGVAKKQAAAA